MVEYVVFRINSDVVPAQLEMVVPLQKEREKITKFVGQKFSMSGPPEDAKYVAFPILLGGIPRWYDGPPDPESGVEEDESGTGEDESAGPEAGNNEESGEPV